MYLPKWMQNAAFKTAVKKSLFDITEDVKKTYPGEDFGEAILKVAGYAEGLLAEEIKKCATWESKFFMMVARATLLQMPHHPNFWTEENLTIVAKLVAQWIARFGGNVENLYNMAGQSQAEASPKSKQPDGTLKKYYDNGQLMLDMNYKDDELDGLCRVYFKNGKLKREDYYKAGKEDGISKEYHENGKLIKEEHYDNGKLLSEKKFAYYENGQLQSEWNFKNNKYEGTQKSYYESGKLKAEGYCIDGKREGTHKTYYESGKLMAEMSYRDDNPDGIGRGYHENGKLKMEEHYKNGQLLSSTCYDEHGNKI